MLTLLAFTAGVLHALVPDHWLPFVMMGKAQKWSDRKLTGIVLMAGAAHLLSSFLIGLGGIFFGVSLNRIIQWESARGNAASLLFIGFGLTYLLWGIKRGAEVHLSQRSAPRDASHWILFALLVFGPCEPLIPFLFLGSADGWGGLAMLALAFSAATLGTMWITAHLAYQGLARLKYAWPERFSHAFAGGIIALTGLIVRFAGV
jgi:hypothetical protein